MGPIIITKASDGPSYKTTERANRIKSDLRDNMKYCWE